MWPFYVDSDVSPPFRLSNGSVLDAHGRTVKPFPEVQEVLKHLKSLNYEMAIASRTHATQEANKLVELFGWNKYFSYKEIYPGRKTTHISKISKDSGVPLNQIIFFDDETRNINDLTTMKVCSILANNGVNAHVISKGFDTFVELKQRTF